MSLSSPWESLSCPETKGRRRRAVWGSSGMGQARGSHEGDEGRASSAVLHPLVPTWGWAPSLGMSVRTCPRYPAPTSQTRPSGPVLPTCGAASATSPAPGAGPGRWLAAGGMGATGAASPGVG